MPPLTFNESPVIKSSWIDGTQSQGLFQPSSCIGIFLPLEVGEAEIGIAVHVIRTQLHYFFESMDRIGILQLIQIANPEVVPSHPSWIILRWIILRVWGFWKIPANLDRAATGCYFDDRIVGVVLTQHIVEIALPQMTIVDASGNRNRVPY